MVSRKQQGWLTLNINSDKSWSNYVASESHDVRSPFTHSSITCIKDIMAWLRVDSRLQLCTQSEIVSLPSRGASVLAAESTVREANASSSSQLATNERNETRCSTQPQTATAQPEGAVYRPPSRYYRQRNQ